MNRYHRRYCRSDAWAARVRETLLPWVLDGIDLGDRVLEVGPGPGVTTDVLLTAPGRRLVAAEIDADLAAALHRRTAAATPAGGTGRPGAGTATTTATATTAATTTATTATIAGVAVCRADATSLPFADGAFTGAACCTMLHHVGSAALQDRLLAEVRRVLRPGAWFAGCDSRPSTKFRLAHLFDTMVVVDPVTFGDRLRAAGFDDVAVDVGERSFRFRARATRPPTATETAATPTTTHAGG